MRATKYLVCVDRSSVCRSLAEALDAALTDPKVPYYVVKYAIQQISTLTRMELAKEASTETVYDSLTQLLHSLKSSGREK